MFVKALGRDERSADLLFRAYRWIRLRKTGDHRPFVSLRRSVEHEALVSLQAAALGIRTPRILGVTDAGIDGMVLAYEAIDGDVGRPRRRHRRRRAGRGLVDGQRRCTTSGSHTGTCGWPTSSSTPTTDPG